MLLTWEIITGLRIHTLTGNAQVDSLSCPIQIKSMGGNIRVEVAEKTLRTEAEAVTTGGSILIDEELGRTKKGGYPGRQKLEVWLGGGEEGSTLKVKTMGGNIEIRKAPEEPHE